MSPRFAVEWRVVVAVRSMCAPRHSWLLGEIMVVEVRRTAGPAEMVALAGLGKVAIVVEASAVVVQACSGVAVVVAAPAVAEAAFASDFAVIDSAAWQVQLGWGVGRALE